MSVNDVPLWVTDPFDALPSVRVSNHYFGWGSATVDFYIGSFDDYPHQESLAASSVRFDALMADGSEAFDHPDQTDEVLTNEVNIHLPAEPDEQAAIEAGEAVILDRFRDQLGVTTRPLSDGAHAPHIVHTEDAALDEVAMAEVVRNIVIEHPAFSYDASEEGDAINREDIDRMKQEAERLEDDR